MVRGIMVKEKRKPLNCLVAGATLETIKGIAAEAKAAGKRISQGEIIDDAVAGAKFTGDSVVSVIAFSAEVARYEAGIRAHRDQRGDDRCWRDDEDLYKLLPEGFAAPERDTAVELDNCRRFIELRQNPATQYVSPQREIERLNADVAHLLAGQPPYFGGPDSRNESMTISGAPTPGASGLSNVPYCVDHTVPCRPGCAIEAAERAQIDEEIRGGVTKGELRETWVCLHCGTTHEIKPRPNGEVPTMCQECFITGHRTGGVCRKCAELEQLKKLRSEDKGSVAVDRDNVDYDPKVWGP